jgi:hypothetical protein
MSALSVLAATTIGVLGNIPMHTNYFERRQFMPQLYLNTAKCQSPPGANKTTKSMNFIKYSAITSRFISGANENGIHHITLIAANNNLEETKMWKVRTKLDSNIGCLQILCLSSKKEDINTVDKIISMIASTKNASDLPDIIIFCTHKQRIDDMVRLINTLNEGNINLSNKGIHQITASVMFDESDENITLVSDFIKEILEIRTNYTIRDVHLITATPFNDFWKKLKEIGVNRLTNINSILRNGYDSDEYPEIHMSYSELMKKYRQISDHNIRYIDIECKHPTEYASVVLQKILEERRNGLRNDTLTIFAPGETTVKSHINMKNIFLIAGFHVAIHNGTEKGFYSPRGDYISFADFNKQHNVSGEFRDTLVKWREINPTTDLMITGYYNIQRGITFCTIGFNFTDFIVSDWHMKNMGSLIQILGRANGGIEYVQIMNIWSTHKVISAANDQINIMNSILEEDPEEFKENDFRKKTRAELQEIALTVPIIVQLTSEEYNSINKIRRTWNEGIIMDLINSYNPELREELRNLTKDQITQPETENARKKQIVALVAGADMNRKKTISINKINKQKDVFHIFMDNQGKRLIVTRYYGSRLITNENNLETHVPDDSSDSE